AALNANLDPDDPNTRNAIARAVDAWSSLYEAAQTHYKRRITLNRTQTWSKGWGAGVNFVAGSSTFVSLCIPGAGVVPAVIIQGVAIPLQWLAGYRDEFIKHDYN